MERKNILKEVGVLLIAVIMVLTAFVVTANTTKNEAGTIYLFEDFELREIPPPGGWSLVNPGNYWSISSDAMFGNYAAKCFSDVSGFTAYLTSPQIDLTGTTYAYLSFWYKQPNSLTGSTDSLFVMISNDDGITWSEVASYGYETPWQHERIDISAYASSSVTYIRFGVSGFGGSGIFLDEIRVCDGYPTLYMGLEVAPLGKSSLNIIHDNLTIRALPDTIPVDSGLYVNLKYHTPCWSYRIENPDPDNTLPEGAEIQTITTGVVDGIPDQYVSEMILKKEGDKWNYYIDLLEDSYLIDAYFDGVLVYNGEFSPGHSTRMLLLIYAAAVIIAGVWELVDAMKNITHKDLDVTSKITRESRWNQPTLVDITNGPDNLKVDRIVVRSNRTSYDFQALSGLFLRTTDIPSLSMTEMYEQGEPDVPTITGPGIGKVNIENDYTITTTDRENDDVSYHIDWGDGTTSWLGPYASGEEAIATHTWFETGHFKIKIKAEDTLGAESYWGTLPVIMPTSIMPNQWFRQFLQNHLHILPILRQLMGY